MTNALVPREARSRQYDMSTLCSSITSLLWVAIEERRKEVSFTFADIASAVSMDTETLTDWFASDPNWQAEAVADIAGVLSFTVEVSAVDQKTGRRISPTGLNARKVSESQIEEIAQMLQQNSGGVVNSPSQLARDVVELLGLEIEESE